MKFAELAGNMWDDAGALVLDMVKKRGNTISSISEDEKARWIKATEPVIDAWIKQVKDKGLDGGKLIEQATRPGRQVRQGLTSDRRAPSVRRCARPPGIGSRRMRNVAGRGGSMSDADGAARVGRAAARRAAVGRDRRARRPAVAQRGRAGRGSACIGRWLLQLRPINGDFEMVQMATAIAVFSFLPYCQARRGNIVVDTFTSWLPRAHQRLHRCVLGPRLRRHDGPAHRLPDDRRDRALSQRPDHHAAAAHRLAGDRRLRRARCSCSPASRWRRRSARSGGAP